MVKSKILQTLFAQDCKTLIWDLKVRWKVSEAQIILDSICQPY